MFWRGKKVLITGHTGFKGSWLTLWLRVLGADVCGFALPPNSVPNLFELAGVAVDMHSVIGDVADLEALVAIYDEFQPEVVFHMAAQSLVRPSYADPLGTYRTNIMGTANVLEAIRQSTTVRVGVMVTSDKCYANAGHTRGYVETDPMGGRDPYSSSKGCAELVTAAYRNSYFLSSVDSEPTVAIATARAGNVIGGGDWSVDRLVPDLARAFLREQQAQIRNPESVRPWQHVLEPLKGYMLLAEQLWKEPKTFSGGWNFGPKPRDACSVGHLASEFAKAWGNQASWISNPEKTLSEAAILVLDSTKSEQQLAWQQRLNVETAVGWAAQWYKAVSEGGDARALSLEQISTYEKMANGLQR